MVLAHYVPAVIASWAGSLILFRQRLQSFQIIFDSNDQLISWQKHVKPGDVWLGSQKK